MGRICQKCDKTYSCRQSLWKHKKICKGGTNHHSVPYEPETVMGTDVKQYVGSGKVQNQQHSKTLKPKISALADAIVNEEPTSKYLPKDKPTTSLESLTTPLASKKKKKR